MNKQDELSQAEARLSELEAQYAIGDDTQKNDLKPQIESEKQNIETLQHQVSQDENINEPTHISEERTFSFSEEPTNETTATIGQGLSDEEIYQTLQASESQEAPVMEETIEPVTILSSYMTVDEFDNPIEVITEEPNPNYIVYDQAPQNGSLEEVFGQEHSMEDFLSENNIEVAVEQEPPPPPQPELEEPQP